MSRLKSFLSRTSLKSFWVTLIILASATSVSASPIERLIELINSQPEYLEARSRVAMSDWTIATIKAGGKPTLSFKSSGKYPITSNGRDNARSNSGDRYVDGTFSLNIPFSDFGARKSKIEAESFAKDSSLVSLLLKEEEMLFEIIEIGLSIQRDRIFTKSIFEDITEIQKRQAIEKLRYKGGTGTLTTIRELELMVLELQTQLKLRSLDLEISEKTFEDKYGAEPDAFMDDILALANTPMLGPDLDTQLSKLKKFDLDKQAVNKKIQATQLEQYPKIDLTLSAAFYNLSKRFIADREIYGGVSLSLPLFDAGAANSEIKSLEVERQIILSRKKKQNSLIKIQIVEAYALLEKNFEQLNDKTVTIKNLQNTLDELEVKSKSISANTFQAAKTLKEIKEIQRAVEDIRWENKSVQIKLSMLNETLITSLKASQVAAR
jgi:outer membrane protein TolC